MKQVFLLFIGVLLSTSVFSQKELTISDKQRELFSTELLPEAYNDTLMRNAIIYHINKECKKQGIRQFRINKILEYTAIDLAEYIAKREISRLNQIPARKQIHSRLYQYEAGNRDADEIVLKALTKKGRTNLTYNEIAKEITYTLFSRVKLEEILRNPRYTFIGVAARFDENKKRLYISLTFSNYSLISVDKKTIRNSELPITTFQYFLNRYDERTCKGCKKFQDIYSLHDFISVEDNVIYFETDNYRALRKLLRYPKDGLAVDIVMWEQYQCNSENLINNIMINKGHLTRPVYVKNFERENFYKGRLGRHKLKIELGTIPEGIKDYELNLVVINKKSVCASLIPPYNMPQLKTDLPEATAFPDTITTFNTYTFKPRQDTAVISFVIPFEEGKHQYKKEDIEDFIDSLEQPHFNPIKFNITAYSSIDGDPQKNLQLRGARIQSMKNAIYEYTGSAVPIETESHDSWDLFRTDIVATDFQFLRRKSNEGIMEYLKQGDNKELLEPILKKHRFAQVDLTVWYDISTIEKEQEYVLYLFNKALREYRDDDALAIQKYIIEQVLNKRYNRQAIDNMDIPDRPEYAGIQMNKLWLDYEARNMPINEAYVIELRRLKRMAPQNLYIRRNLVFARLQIETIENDSYVMDLQEEIDYLMQSSLPKYVIDPINLQLQIKSLEALNDKLRISNEDQFIEEAFNRIKHIIEIDKDDWKGAFNLAVLFTSMGDYEYPLTVMTPMLDNPEIDENFIFMFISICTHTDYMRYTQTFEHALKRAHEINSKKLCELIDTGKISFQIMDNPEVKEFYCKSCGRY
ncbi:MAG: hypothetical protein R6U95_06425 [Bacteroidales bacterium]